MFEQHLRFPRLFSNSHHVLQHWFICFFRRWHPGTVRRDGLCFSHITLCTNFRISFGQCSFLGNRYFPFLHGVRQVPFFNKSSIIFSETHYYLSSSQPQDGFLMFLVTFIIKTFGFLLVADDRLVTGNSLSPFYFSGIFQGIYKEDTFSPIWIRRWHCLSEFLSCMCSTQVAPHHIL